jgi:CheY-specific phosphatase CheX
VQALLDDVMTRIGNDLMGGISNAVVDTVDSLFGEKMHPVDNKDKEGLFSIAVDVNLRQGTKNARLRLVFDHSLLESLISAVYTKEQLQDNAVLADAAEEITNIVCNKIKAFLNKRGFEVEMDLPKAEPPEAAEQVGPEVICLGFSTYRNRLSVRKILHVGLS